MGMRKADKCSSAIAALAATDCNVGARNRERARIIIAGAGLLLLAGPARAADEFKYDPASCKADAHGKLYVGLGDYVLAVPTTGDSMVNLLPPAKRRPAPNPDEPEGCLGNPAQMYGYSFLYQWREARDAKWGIAPEVHPGTDLLQVGAVPRGTRPSVIGSRLEFAEKECKRATLVEELPNGLTACRIKPTPPAPVEDWGASYIAHPEVYTAPLGERFVVDCGPMLKSWSYGGYCDTTYLLMPGLVIAYRFQPFQGPRAVPIDSIIEFDRGLRAWLLALLVKDYAWPTDDAEPKQATGKPPP
jgi:hypothetical protein